MIGIVQHTFPNAQQRIGNHPKPTARFGSQNLAPVQRKMSQTHTNISQ